LVIIGILLYILYRLLLGPRKKKGYGKNGGPASPGGAVQDVLVEDPVCHTYIPKGQAVQLPHINAVKCFSSKKELKNEIFY
jgi:hypothetical protein